MTKKAFFWIVLSALIMLLIPWIAVTFVRSDLGMASILTMFFAVDPIYCATAGVCAGKQIRILWWVPLMASLLFLAGTWLFFELGEKTFLLYAGIYFILSMTAMFISRNLEKRSADNG